MDELTFAYYPVFTGSPDLRDEVSGRLDQLAHESEILFKEWADRISVRGTYSTVGFRADAELMMW